MRESALAPWPIQQVHNGFSEGSELLPSPMGKQGGTSLRFAPDQRPSKFLIKLTGLNTRTGQLPSPLTGPGAWVHRTLESPLSNAPWVPRVDAGAPERPSGHWMDPIQQLPIVACGNVCSATFSSPAITSKTRWPAQAPAPGAGTGPCQAGACPGWSAANGAPGPQLQAR